MPLTVVPELLADDHDGTAGAASSSLIDQIAREVARQVPAAALQAEVDAYIAAFADERDEHGRRLVVRNGSHQPRDVSADTLTEGHPRTLFSRSSVA